MKGKPTEEERRVGRELLNELDELIWPDTSGKYVEFSFPLKENWMAFQDRWGRVVHLRSPRAKKV